MKNAILEADEMGAKEIHVLGVHGEFAGDAYEMLSSLKLKNAEGPFFHISDTVDNPVSKISTTNLVAQALHYIPEQYYIGD